MSRTRRSCSTLVGTWTSWSASSRGWQDGSSSLSFRCSGSPSSTRRNMRMPYPDLQVAYLEEEPPRKEGGDPRIFSSLIDGHSEFVPENGHRRPKSRIELPGNPILGDGKSDNQNHAIIFYRGEYLQLIDANQDNYLEECLKIRNVLAEFEEYSISGQNLYAH